MARVPPMPPFPLLEPMPVFLYVAEEGKINLGNELILLELDQIRKNDRSITLRNISNGASKMASTSWGLSDGLKSPILGNRPTTGTTISWCCTFIPQSWCQICTYHRTSKELTWPELLTVSSGIQECWCGALVCAYEPLISAINNSDFILIMDGLEPWIRKVPRWNQNRWKHIWQLKFCTIGLHTNTLPSFPVIYKQVNVLL